MSRRVAALGLLVPLIFQRATVAQTPIDSSLYAYIQSIRAIDNHAHPVSMAPLDSDYDALPLDGIPAFDFPIRLRADNPELLTAWRELFGYPYTDRTEPHLAELRRLKARARADQGERYPAWILDKLGIDVQLANRMALGPGITAPRFRWVSFVDALILPLATKALQTTPDRADLYPRETRHLRRYLRALGLSTLPNTFAAYLSTVVTPTLERMQREGAVAIKFEAAYLRPLSFDPASLAQARAVYERNIGGRGPTMAVYKPLQDFLFRYVAREAGRIGLAVHVHSADGAGGYFEAAGSNPILLESAFNDPALRQAKFVIVHGGWPHPRNTISLFGKPNVYADFSFLGNLLTAHMLAEVLREWLSTYPERVLFGSDAYKDSEEVGWEEWGWMGATVGRKALAIALTGMMRDGEIDRDRAQEIARMALRDNAAKLYGIP